VQDPQFDALTKSIEAVDALAAALRTIQKCLKDYPEARTIVGRSFRTPTVQAKELIARLPRPTRFAKFIDAIVEALRKQKGEWITIRELAVISKISRATLRRVIESDEHSHLFEPHFVSPRRLKVRLKDDPKLSAQKPPSPPAARKRTTQKVGPAIIPGAPDEVFLPIQVGHRKKTKQTAQEDAAEF
jgi:hypothetical protein